MADVYCTCGHRRSDHAHIPNERCCFVVGDHLCECRRFTPSTIEIAASDNVEHPAHYTRGKIETWDFIIDQQLGFCEGNVIKYVVRAKYKGNELEDLRKAKQYLDKLIASKSGSEFPK